jgi:hypothetical protein
MIGGNVNQCDQSHVNIRHKILDWFRHSRGVIALRPVLLYYAIEIDSSLFLSGSFGGFSRSLPHCLWDFSDVLNIDLSSLFIVRKSPHRV